MDWKKGQKVVICCCIFFMFFVSIFFASASDVFEVSESKIFDTQKSDDFHKQSSVDVLGPMESCWPTYGQNNQHTGLSPYPTRDNPMTIKWKFKTEYLDFGSSSPVIDENGVLYIGARDTFLYAINPNGTERWRYDLKGQSSSSPAIAEDGTIYVGCGDYKLYAINSDGTLKWCSSFSGAIKSSPTIGTDGTIYFCSTGPNYNGGRIVAVNPDGSEKWHSDISDYASSTPALGKEETIYISCDDCYLYSLNPENGSIIWKYKTEEMLGTPSIAEDGTIYGASYDNYLYAIYPNGTLRWKTEIYEGSEGTPVIGSDGIIYVGSHHFHAIYPNGTQKWEYIGLIEHGSRALCRTYALSSDGLLYFVSSKTKYPQGGDLFVLDCHDGNLVYQRTIASNQNQYSQPAIGNDGTVYIVSRIWGNNTYGCLYAFGAVEGNHAPKQPTITGEQTGRIWWKQKYSFSIEDIDNDEIYLFVDWGDDNNTGWLGPYESGEKINLSYAWEEKGDYVIEAYCMDEHDQAGNHSVYPIVMSQVRYVWFESLMPHSILGRWIN